MPLQEPLAAGGGSKVQRMPITAYTPDTASPLGQPLKPPLRSPQVRTLAETVRLDARTKLLNPKWYEGMLNSGYEGVREIDKRPGPCQNQPERICRPYFDAENLFSA